MRLVIEVAEVAAMPSLQLNLKVMLERKGSRATIETPAKRPRGRPPGPKLRKDDPALEALLAMPDDHQAYYHELKPETPRMRRAGSGQFGDRWSLDRVLGGPGGGSGGLTRRAHYRALR